MKLTNEMSTSRISAYDRTLLLHGSASENSVPVSTLIWTGLEIVSGEQYIVDQLKENASLYEIFGQLTALDFQTVDAINSSDKNRARVKSWNEQRAKYWVDSVIITYIYHAGETDALDIVNGFIESVNADISSSKLEGVVRAAFSTDSLASFNHAVSARRAAEIVKNAEDYRVMMRVDKKLKAAATNPKFEIRDILTLTETRMYTPLLVSHGKEVPQGDRALFIFDYAVPSKFVPYLVCYNDHAKPFYKAYMSDKDNFAKHATDFGDEGLDTNIIYGLICINTEVQVKRPLLHKAKALKYVKMKYDVDSNMVTIKARSSVQEQCLKRLQDVFPKLLFGNGHLLSGRSGVSLRLIDCVECVDISLKEYVLIHMIMNPLAEHSELYKSLLIVKDRKVPYPLRKSLTLMYKGIMHDTDRYYTDEDSITFSIATKAAVEGGSDYFVVDVTSPGKLALDNFLKMFIPLFTLYYTDHVSVVSMQEATLGRMIPNLSILDAKEVLQKFEVQADRYKNAARKYHSHFPQVFPADYDELAPEDRMVLVGDLEDAKRWEMEVLKIGARSIRRQVLEWPPQRFLKNGEKPLFYYTNFSNKYPYPGVAKTTMLEHEYIPYSYGKTQIDESKPSLYNVFYLDIEPESAKSKIIITSSKVLGDGRIGVLPAALDTLLSFYRGADVNEMIRIGVCEGIGVDVNSVISCIAVALGKDSLSTSMETAAERAKIAKHVKDLEMPALMKQELFDVEDAEILELLASKNDFLDTYLFYRSLEEYYDINLYVFASDGRSSMLYGQMEIPRSSAFHTRLPNLDRSCVLVYKNSGIPSDSLHHHVYELIAEDIQGSLKVVFGKEMNKHCHDIITEADNPLTWNNLGDVRQYSNFYNYVNYPQMLASIGATIAHQHVDSSGKMRSLTFKLSGKLATISFPPAQPGPYRTSHAVHSVSQAFAREIMGKQTPRSIVDGGMWYSFAGVEFCIFVHATVKGVGEGPNNPRTINVDSSYKLRMLRKMLGVVIQCVEWVYSVELLQPGEFMKRYTSVLPLKNAKDVEEVNYYDTAKITEFFPKVTTTTEAITYLRTAMPHFSNGKTLVFRTEDLRAKIGLTLNKTLNTLSIYGKTSTGRVKNFYEGPSSFQQNKSVKLIIGKDAKIAWFSQFETKRGVDKDVRYKINKRLDVSMSQIREPMLYASNEPTKPVYIVQNTRRADLNTALSVCRVWSETGKNPGYYHISEASTAKKRGERPYILYEISQSGHIEPIQDKTDGNRSYYIVATYGGVAEGSYCSLLQIGNIP